MKGVQTNDTLPGVWFWSQIVVFPPITIFKCQRPVMVMLHMHRCSSGNESCTTLIPKDLPSGTLFHERNPPMCSGRFAYKFPIVNNWRNAIALLVVFFFPESSFTSW